MKIKIYGGVKKIIKEAGSCWNLNDRKQFICG